MISHNENFRSTAEENIKREKKKQTHHKSSAFDAGSAFLLFRMRMPTQNTTAKIRVKRRRKTKKFDGGYPRTSFTSPSNANVVHSHSVFDERNEM